MLFLQPLIIIMKRKKISLFFVQLAMMVFLLHAIVPHCHHANGQVRFFFQHYLCEHIDCDHHHGEEESSDCESHLCHNHHAGDHDNDCVLNQPFIKGGEDHDFQQLSKMPLQTLHGVALEATNLQINLENATSSHRYYPREDNPLISLLLTSSVGLRAPPAA